MTDPPLEAETPVTTPGKKRRGLALPPRGQALTRLQDLEKDEPLPMSEEAMQEVAPNASPGTNTEVNTASSNAVNTASSTDLQKAVLQEESPQRAVPSPSRPAANPPLVPRQAREATTRITVDMPDSLHRRVSLLSVETRRSIKDLVIEALEACYFRPQEPGSDT